MQASGHDPDQMKRPNGFPSLNSPKVAPGAKLSKKCVIYSPKNTTIMPFLKDACKCFFLNILACCVFLTFLDFRHQNKKKGKGRG